jgi:hypothetical protein
VQRDELIYRAGWAAAEMRANSRCILGDGNARRVTGLYSTVAWSVASAACAASLALAMTLRPQPTANTRGDAAGDAVAVATAADVSATGSEEPPPPLAGEVFGGVRRGSAVDWTASLLIMRDQALLQQWEDPRLASETVFNALTRDHGIRSQPKTSREMLRELLPGNSRLEASESNATQGQLHWPWNTSGQGDTT